MVYKILFGGRGADLYIHNIDEQKKQKLLEMNIQKKPGEPNYLSDVERRAKSRLGIQGYAQNSS